MKRLLLPLIAALALPTAANAETVYLVVRLRESLNYLQYGVSSSSFFVPMETMSQCEEAGVKLKASQRFGHSKEGWSKTFFECIEGK